MLNGTIPLIRGNQNTTKLINQLKQSAKQYKTLSKDEEQLLISKYKNNREQLNKLLQMHNIKLVFNIAKKYMSKTKDFDTLVMNGMKGLAEAATRFDITKNIKFVTYAHWWIRKYILGTFDQKKNFIENHSISFDSPVTDGKNGQDGSTTTFANVIDEYVEPSQYKDTSIAHELSSIEQKEICKHLYEALEQDTSLSADDKNIFIDYLYHKEKSRDIAMKYGVDVQEIFKIKNTVLDKFKNILSEQYDIKSYKDVM